MFKYICVMQWYLEKSDATLKKNKNIWSETKNVKLSDYGNPKTLCLMLLNARLLYLKQTVKLFTISSDHKGGEEDAAWSKRFHQAKKEVNISILDSELDN